MSFEQILSDQFVLRSVRDEDDISRVASFNTVYLNALEGATAACLMHHHPETTLDDYWLVEDLNTGEIVSTTCLLPWHGVCCGLDLRIAQLEMVLTHPAYRGRGLIRVQIKHFEQTARERGFDLNIIWGIPYYYRQYGYTYTLDGSSMEALSAWSIPGSSSDDLSVKLRPASSRDIPALTRLYNETTAALDFFISRSPTYWRYLLESARHPIKILEHVESGATLGYIIVERTGGDIKVLESGLPDALVSMALLKTLKDQNMKRILVSWSQHLPLVVCMRSLGSQTLRGGQWLVRIPDLHRLLTTLKPVLEQRLSSSPWRGLTTELTINLYREAFSLRFEHGILTALSPLGFRDYSMGADGGDLCIPPEAFVRLITGHCVLQELFEPWPDIVVKPQVHYVIDCLFPRMKAFLSAPYHYLGSNESL